MEQLSFSQHQPDQKIFFLGALAGLARAAAGRAAAGRAAAGKSAAGRAAAGKSAASNKTTIPLKITTGDINIGNKQEEN